MRLLTALVAVVAALGAAGPAVAQTPESEPNDGVRAATGPLAGATDYTGALSGGTDRDWFFFYVPASSDHDIVLTNTSRAGGCTELRVQIMDSDARPIQSFGSEIGDDPKHVRNTADSAQRYYVLIDSEGGCRPAGRTRASYTLRVDGAVTQERPPGVSGPPPCQDARDRFAAAQAALRRARRSGSRRRVRTAR